MMHEHRVAQCGWATWAGMFPGCRCILTASLACCLPAPYEQLRACVRMCHGLQGCAKLVRVTTRFYVSASSVRDWIGEVGPRTPVEVKVRAGAGRLARARVVGGAADSWGDDGGGRGG